MGRVLEGQNQCSHRCNNFWLKAEAKSAFNRAEILSGVDAFIKQHVTYVCMHLKNRGSPLHSQNI